MVSKGVIFSGALFFFILSAAYSADSSYSNGLYLDIGPSNGLLGQKGEMQVVQEAPGGGILLGSFTKDAPNEFNPQAITIDVGSSNGLIGKKGNVVVVKEAPGGGIPLGTFQHTQVEIKPSKLVQIIISKSNGLVGKKGNIAVVQAYPGGGKLLLDLPYGASTSPGNVNGWTRIYIGPSNGLVGKKGDIVISQDAPVGGRLLAIYPRDAIDLSNPQDEANALRQNVEINDRAKKNLREEGRTSVPSSSGTSATGAQ